MNRKVHWPRVTRRNPCPICGHGDYCGFTPDLTSSVCMRVPSGKPIETGLGRGYIHKLDGSVIPPPERKAKPIPFTPVTDWNEYMDGLHALMEPSRLAGLSTSLGVTCASLARLGAAWRPGRSGTNIPPEAYYDAWAFPMRSPDGEIIGIRLRADTGKFAVTGSRAGLFLPDGYMPDQLTQALICEGPTDCAAVLDLGFYGVGRPSCGGCEAEVVSVMRGRDAIIIGDRDVAKTRPDGSTWFPGQEGAERLVRALKGQAKSVRLVYPMKGKDIRAWKQQGCTAELLQCVINNAKLR